MNLYAYSSGTIPERASNKRNPPKRTNEGILDLTLNQDLDRSRLRAISAGLECSDRIL